jgi:hypothetical protein
MLPLRGHPAEQRYTRTLAPAVRLAPAGTVCSAIAGELIRRTKAWIGKQRLDVVALVNTKVDLHHHYPCLGRRAPVASQLPLGAAFDRGNALASLLALISPNTRVIFGTSEHPLFPWRHHP